MQEEIWKDIVGYEGLYQVSNLGRVKRVSRYVDHKDGKHEFLKEKILKTSIDKMYERVGLMKNGKRIKYFIHRLVAIAFIPNPFNFPEINHKDENKLNNNVSNLEWCTRSYNCKYGNIQNKKNKYRYKKINQYDLDGNHIKTWNNATEIEKELGISQNMVKRCCRKIRNKTHNYRWEYA